MTKKPTKNGESNGQTARDDALGAAITMHREGRVAEAEAAYEGMLEDDENDVDALHFLGVLRHQQRDSEQALALIDRALTLLPDYLDARNNRGNILKECGRLEEAEKDYRAVLAERPDHPEAGSNLGAVLRARGEPDAAIDVLARTLKHHPMNTNAWMNAGHALWASGAMKSALHAFENAVHLKPDHVQATLSMGELLASGGKMDAALKIFERILAKDPDHAVAKHMLAACTNTGVPDRASDGFVSAVFDSFADSFDTILAGLNYHAPALVLEAFNTHCPEGWIAERLCDLGCGTGLCGPLFEPHAQERIGVDLSRGMLEKAAARGCYHELHQADIEAYLQGVERPVDLIVAADTLCYLGVLDGVFGAAAAAAPGGWFLFTVEHLPDDERPSSDGGYRLHAHGRYGHHRAYVERSLRAAGWEPLDITPGVLRREARKDVNGLVVTARHTGQGSP